MTGPLAGVRVIELAGIGPAPFAAMMLADLGADVLRVERMSVALNPDGTEEHDLLNRGRRSVAVDLKQPEAVALVLDLVGHADALIEGFRPGVAERLGVGPDACLARNPRLVYSRMTGWGQEGPLAQRAGHDIGFIAVAGALHPIGRAGEAPVPPVNLVGDFGGGGMLLALGVACALIERQTSGVGQVVDAAIVDGAALLTTMLHSFRTMGLWSDGRGTNHLDTGAPFYDVYETADGEYLAVGAVEPQFYAELVTLLGLDPAALPDQWDRASWPTMKCQFAEAVRGRTLAEWVTAAEGNDACVAPVLGLGAAPDHPQNAYRNTFSTIAGVVQPSPAPRFSRTPGEISRPPSRPGADADTALLDWGVSPEEIRRLRRATAVF